jgi:hypothetical protein
MAPPRTGATVQTQQLEPPRLEQFVSLLLTAARKRDLLASGFVTMV